MGTRKLRDEVEVDMEPRETVLLPLGRALGVCEVKWVLEACERHVGIGMEAEKPEAAVGGNWRPSVLEREAGRVEEEEEDEQAVLENLRRSFNDFVGGRGEPMPRDAGRWGV